MSRARCCRVCPRNGSACLHRQPEAQARSVVRRDVRDLGHAREARHPVGGALVVHHGACHPSSSWESFVTVNFLNQIFRQMQPANGPGASLLARFYAPTASPAQTGSDRGAVDAPPPPQTESDDRGPRLHSRSEAESWSDRRGEGTGAHLLRGAAASAPQTGSDQGEELLRRFYTKAAAVAQAESERQEQLLSCFYTQYCNTHQNAGHSALLPPLHSLPSPAPQSPLSPGSALKKKSGREPITNKNRWAPDEDDRVRQLVVTYGDKDWVLIACHMATR